MSEQNPLQDLLDRPSYRGRIQGEPGVTVASGMTILAALSALAGLGLGAMLMNESPVVAAASIAYGIIGAGFIYAFSILVENAIAIRVEAELHTKLLVVCAQELEYLAELAEANDQEAHSTPPAE
ncbi:MAG: hypothetical protein LCH53_07400 [Bacteroidetes bacterium]|nr:hypothetical protein [Bacteroidota bacterium]